MPGVIMFFACCLLTARRGAGFVFRSASVVTRAEKAICRNAVEEGKKETPSFPLSAMDIRVGLFVSAREHPDSDKLFIEDIDLGEEEPRQIVSGLRAYYKLADLEDRRCLVVANLPKAKLAGIESFGMVLCGSENDKEKVEFITPPEDAEIGDRIFVEDDDGTPMTPNQVKKKKVWNAVAPSLAVIDGVASFKGMPLKAESSEGTCAPASIQNGPIS